MIFVAESVFTDLARVMVKLRVIRAGPLGADAGVYWEIYIAVNTHIQM